ncbi:MAG: DUF4382 domain-containing protein [Burkholderiaceae bacterium]|nr:MAG: DUF4382 domain-containing protein [Burkholderiaceae bacterium]
MSSRTRSWLNRGILALAGLGLTALLAACGGGGDSAGGTGTLRMSMTDAPACGYDHVWIDVQTLRINQSATAGAADAGWASIPVNTRIDLLTLNNGILQTLGEIPLQTGKYQQLRLVLGNNNSIVPSGGTETPLTVPSGMQSGIKLNADITIAANQMADFVLDFNACKSIVKAGASGKYLLKPVIAVTPNYLSGVRGYVDASLVQPTTTVSVEQAGVVVRSTVPLNTGEFVLPVAPGTYDLVITSAGHVTAVVTGVVVSTATVTTVSSAGAAINPPTSAMGTAAGTVSTPTSPIDATVDATQALSSGDTIDVAGGPVDADTGAYTYALPTGAPVVAPYVAATPTTLNFIADGAAAGQYALVAASGGTVKPAVPITVAAGATTTTNFTFP